MTLPNKSHRPPLFTALRRLLIAPRRQCILRQAGYQRRWVEDGRAEVPVCPPSPRGAGVGPWHAWRQLPRWQALLGEGATGVQIPRRGNDLHHGTLLEARGWIGHGHAFNGGVDRRW